MVRGRGDKDRNIQLGREAIKPGNVIAVLVRDDDGTNIFNTLAKRTQALESFAAGEACINQNSRRTGRYERAVSAATAGEH